MEINTGHRLSVEQKQTLAITTEMVQSIQILQYNTYELNTYLEEQLLNNPVLEASENTAGEESFDEKISSESDIDWNEYINDRRYDDISYMQPVSKNSEDSNYENYITSEITFTEYLNLQMELAAQNKKDEYIGKYIIESLDENGYLRATVEELAERIGMSEKSIETVLNIIHTFDPYGVGARTLSECLIIQLERKNLMTDKLRMLVEECLEDLAANRISLIAKKLKVSVKEVQEMVDVIKSLEPKPGRGFAVQADTKYIIPDIFVEESDGRFFINLNERNSPQLVVSSYYRTLLNKADDISDVSDYLKDRLDSAVWLVNSIEQRKNTIRKVAQAIVDYQHDFFDKGIRHMKPLTMKMLAEEVGIHESTVSRAVNGKYLQCSKGVFELKYFFTAKVSSENEDDDISLVKVKYLIKNIIENEDELSPYSDQLIAEKLLARNIKISRRTVAKYREEMNIPASSKRRRYH